ncbi:polysaccharide biosynthesis/export family protein [Haliscomenobacter hydrossis]|uniref:Polysaccharide export protein n=1 Tax=Haliscomenobacter hydrossis (strain ATCC 27775 / DSM 1100 / LMG 10767 / O) TaxID=760192 RepID=F4KR17_HALH1|nr:polysaccharide biosynthesis/export family protein [Haliscomenobacter hydrossis]AEE53255.1 polysaccharide export protein [Haliscomenobacter hydrossis DSM 1100]
MRIFSLLFWVFIVLGLTSSCVSHKQLLNYQENLPDTAFMAPKKHPNISIQPNDVLGIKVFSTEMELAAPFNVTSSQFSESFINIESIQLSGYLVSQEGTISFPVLGNLKLEGLSISEARDSIVEKLKQHLKDPIVNLRLLNFRVTVSGEVKNPGAFNVINERISLLDALALAGDLTDYADRKDVLLVREVGGVQSLNRINLQTASFFQSEFYYLRQNDLIYVKPIKAKSGAVQDQTSKAVPILTAAATVAAVLIALFTQ